MILEHIDHCFFRLTRHQALQLADGVPPVGWERRVRLDRLAAVQLHERCRPLGWNPLKACAAWITRTIVRDSCTGERQQVLALYLHYTPTILPLDQL